MSRRKNIDFILKNWDYSPGEVKARLVRGDDGRELLQMRIDMGVVQLEVANRPDGVRPHGAETYFDYLLAQNVGEGEEFRLTEEQCAEVDREFVQFYQRRICWLALGEFKRAIRDADHSLAFMDFVRGCSPSDDWTTSHEQYRPFILFHRTQAAANACIADDRPERAIEEVNQGLERIRKCFVDVDAEDHFDDDELVARLKDLREKIRQHYDIGKTLGEQLAEAVANEQYEEAARLRDEIAKRGRGKR